MYLTYSFYATFYFFMFYSIGAWGQAKCRLNPRFVIPGTMTQLQTLVIGLKGLVYFQMTVRVRTLPFRVTDYCGDTLLLDSSFYVGPVL